MQQPSDPVSALASSSLGRHLFECSPDCVKILSDDGRILAMNTNGLCAMEIDSFARVAGLPWRSFWPHDSQDEIDAALARARAGGTGHFKAYCPTAKGAPRWWEVVVTTLPGENGGVDRLLAVSRDVTQAHHANRELQASEARLRAFVTATSAIMWNSTAAGRFDTLQPGWSAFTGQDFAQYRDNGWLDAIHPDDRAATLATLQEALRTKELYQMRHRVRRADGQFRHMNVRGVPLLDAAGNPVEWVGAHTDITDQVEAEAERKRGEIALHESRERFAKIVHQAATGVVQMDPQGHITLVNQKFCDMVGRSEAELIGMNVLRVTAPDSLEATRAVVADLAAGGAGAVLEKHYLHKDGTLVSATSSVNALRDADGAFQGLVAIVLDTTESRRAAERLRASEERYRTLFESMDQGFAILEMIFDADGRAVDYRFLEMNAMFTHHTGFADAVGKTARELVPSLDRFWFDTYGRVAVTGEAVRFESEAAAIGRWFDVYATRMGAAGDRKVAILFSDITARKRSEEQLQRLASDLSDADRRKTEFLATLAHELRNPLAPIRSGLAVLRLSGDQAAAVAKVRAMMERQVGHMVHLIDDLLDIARISGGKLELKRELADLRQILGSAVETSQPLIDAGGHRLHVDLPDEALNVDADATRIAQVVANLLNNAAKYTPPGGRIDLTLRRQDERAVITVTDSGVGIPADALDVVFDMFKQVDRHAARAQGGLGIGLSLVRRLVEMHGGSVTASSAGSGRGSTFVVSLPLAASAASRLPQREQATADGAGRAVRVLVADDNVDAALTLGMIIEASGHQVCVVHDGAAALAAVRRFQPQLAFLDIGMPGMDGYQTAKAMRRTPGLEGLTLVALTGWGTEGDRQRSADAGFDHHLTKPAQLQAVQALLAGVAAREASNA